MRHPYVSLPKEAFWRSSVSEINPLEVSGLWQPKWVIEPENKVVTFGSCFAQHISRALQSHGFSWLNCEPGPEFASAELNKAFNYNIYSARTGNIYTTRALLQWVSWSLGKTAVPTEVWVAEERFFDPFRPAIEPEGFASRDELVQMRTKTLEAFERCLREADIFVFTMGLTESWENIQDGYAYATCPGTNAGIFDKQRHTFRNFSYNEVMSDLVQALGLIREVNPDIRVLLTVSPVPLTATAAGKHVVVSTTYSKSVLRGVAGELSDSDALVDYFPSYEIITAPSFRGMFYDPNMRTVSKKGVDFVMSHFLSGLGSSEAVSSADPVPVGGEANSKAHPIEEDDLKCEEAILDAFSPKAKAE